MAKITIPTYAMVHRLNETASLAHLLTFPGFSRLGSSVFQAQKTATQSLTALTNEVAPLNIASHFMEQEPELEWVSITINPNQNNRCFTTPYEMSFAVAVWQYDEDYKIARVPLLDISVITRKRERFQKQLKEEIQSAVARLAGDSLVDLVHLNHQVEVILEKASRSIQFPSAREYAEKTNPVQKRQKVLEEVGTDLKLMAQRGALPRGYLMKNLVFRLLEMLAGERPACVLLTGPSGVGKTAVLYETVNQFATTRLSNQPVFETSGGQLIAGMSFLGEWQERLQKVIKEARNKGAIVYFGNLMELMEVGKYEGNSTSIGSFLRPYLQRGSIIAVAECTDEQMAVIEQNDPGLLAAFERLPVPELSLTEGREVLRRCALEPHRSLGVKLEKKSLQVLDNLHRRYSSYSAYPGRPLQFLTNLMEDLNDQGEKKIIETDVVEAFSRQSGLPLLLLDDQERLVPEELKNWLSERVIGQDQAIETVLGLVATVKSALARPDQPLASLLFVGPTGVGKTQLAKTLAEFFFGDADRLVRFDMSEYATPAAVGELTGGLFGSEGKLTSTIRKDPFSVLLLDEVEKAHPLFFDLLLQILGEGRLTDAGGRLANFTNAVVIMTSNLGARGMKKPKLGFGEQGKSAQEINDHFQSVVQAHFRPELFNRIDRVVPFNPLDHETVQAIALRQIQQLKTRDGLMGERVHLDLDPAVASFLADRGFDPVYGARPLIRTIEQKFLAPLAQILNQFPEHLEVAVKVETAGDHLEIKGRAIQDKSGWQHQQTSIAQKASRLRFRTMACQRGPLMSEVATKGSMAEIQLIHQLKKKRNRNSENPLIGKTRNLIAESKSIESRMNTLVQRSIELENSCLMNLFGRGDSSPSPVSPTIEAIESDLTDLVEEVACRDFDFPHQTKIQFYAIDRETLEIITQAYQQVGKMLGAGVTVFFCQPGNKPEAKSPHLTWTKAKKSSLFSLPEKVENILLEFKGQAISLKLNQVKGRIRLIKADQDTICQTKQYSKQVDFSKIKILSDKRTLRADKQAHCCLDMDRREWHPHDDMIGSQKVYNWRGQNYEEAIFQAKKSAYENWLKELEADHED